ncbi:alanine--tRNA ligase [Candidatus Nomurabacteria bacterium]|nr:alanine--tRNA ligase [Candidatus Nomurabacteria bacterium]
MTSNEIRQKFLKFFENRGHKIIPSASLVPENDPSVLFNTAGMQPLVPYLLGQKHPMGNRLVDVQKCVRTGDIDDVGDNRHCTFFEMLGNWSLGDYFKDEAIKWSFEFLTDKEEGLDLDMNRIYVTVFEGNDDAPRDDEAADIWKKYLPEGRVYFLPAKNNWWSAGENGPCGPDTEIFYDPNEIQIGDMSHDEFVKADDEGKVIEIWNNVFMQYEKKEGKVVGKLAQHNVDTGMGLERIVMVKQGVKTVFDTDLFEELIKKIVEAKPFGIPPEESWSHEKHLKSIRIIADHMRTAVFMIADGVIPSNTGSGYVLRRLLRRITIHVRELNIQIAPYWLVDIIADKYKDVYSNILEKKQYIENIINEEELKFIKTLDLGLNEFEKITNRYFFAKNDEKPEKMNLILGNDAFNLFQSFGFPIELTIEMAKEKDMVVDIATFNLLRDEHSNLSRTSSAGMFKGGLAGNSDKIVKLHTAHHLLLAGLQAIVDPGIKQRGSNITEERLRMDFMCDHKLTDEEKKKVEDWVNDRIKENLNVIRREMPLAEAEKLGAQMEFGAKYPDIVSVYFVEDKDGDAISKEFCGGPHVENTGVLGHFKIQKEEASSAGVRRIKAVLE